jgi:putative ABC transport system substrate-binding protein
MSVALADAQLSKQTPVIGILGSNPPTTSEGARVWEGFALGLRERGWVEGKNLRIERRWSDGRAERFPELAAEFLRVGVDLIFTTSSQATKAAKDATGTIPIVFVGVADPIGAGFVTSLASPGGNITGVTNQLGDLAGKWLQLAKNVNPRLRHVGIMWNPADPGSALSFKDSQETFARLGIKLTSVPVKAPEDFDASFEILSRERPDFLIVHPSPVIFRHRQRVAEFAVRHRLPTGTGARGGTEDGSLLLSYGPDVADILRRGAGYVDRILKGARPASLPVEQPTRFELVVNRRVARAIGLELTQALLAQADEVID